MRKKIAIYIFITLVATLGAQNKANAYDTKLDFKQNVYERTLKFIEDNPDSPDLAKLYFNLAEISIEVDREHPGKIAGYYKKVIELDPTFANRDAALYNYAFFATRALKERLDEERIKYINAGNVKLPSNLLYTEVNFQEAIKAYSELYANKKSEYNSEVLLRLGNIYFDIAFDSDNPQVYYQKAYKYFDELAKKENDPYQLFGVFQKGWINFVSGNYEPAIEDFSSILREIENSKDKANQSYFEEGALENIANSLMEFDQGFEKKSVAAEQARKLLLKLTGEEYAKRIIKASIDLKQKYNAPMQAVDFYNTYIELFPQSTVVPSYIDSIVTIYKNNSDRTRENKDPRDLIFQERVRLVENYHVGSAWYLANKGKDIAAQLKIIGEAYAFVEERYYNQVIDSPTKDNYLKYNDLVNSYLAFAELNDPNYGNIKYVMIDRLAELSFLVAEKTTAESDYLLVRDNFYRLNSQYPQNEKYLQAEERSFYAVEKIFNDYNKNKSAAQVQDNDAYYDSLYIAGSLRYEQVLAKSKTGNEQELARIARNRAYIYYRNKDFAKAMEAYEGLLQFNPNNEIKKDAYIRLAEINYDRKQYRAAENYYEQAASLSDATEKKTLEQNKLAAINAQAEELKTQKSYGDAATAYLRLAAAYKESDPEIAKGYELKTIAVYKASGQYQQAIDKYVGIAKQGKTKDEILASYASAWALSDSLKNYRESEDLRKAFIEKYPNSNEAFKLEMEIIGFYENNPYQDKRKAAEMYLSLHTRAKTMDLGTVKPQELLQKAIVLYDQLGDTDKKIELMLSYEKQYPGDAAANDYLALVANVYEQRGEEEKFAELAKYLYKKDPKINIYENIAKKNLQELLQKADDAYKLRSTEGLSATLKKLGALEEEYTSLSKKYKANGLTALPYDVGFEEFKGYRGNLEFLLTFDKKLAKVEDDFLKKEADEIITVNRNTTWKNHLTGGRYQRFQGALDEAKKQSDELYALLTTAIEKGYIDDIPVEKRTKLLYLCGKVNDYAAEVIEKQLHKYIEISNEVDLLKQDMKSYDQYVTYFRNIAYNDYQVKALQLAVTYYKAIMENFVDGQNYADDYTKLAEKRLIELNVRQDGNGSSATDRIIKTDATWLVYREVADSLNSANSNAWINATVMQTLANFENAALLQGSIFKKEISIPEQTLGIMIEYLVPCELWINGAKINAVPEKSSLELNGNTATKYTLKLTEGFQAGDNSFIFKLVAAQGNFAAAISFVGR